MCDWLDNEWPAEILRDYLDLIRLTPNLDWLLLTKRIGNWEARLTVTHQCVVKAIGGGTAEHATHPLWELGMWIQDWIAGKPPANVWLGVTICNQTEADRDVPKLLRVPAAVRFLSIEPMLGAIDITEHLWGRAEPCAECPKSSDCGCGWYPRGAVPDEPALHWIIAGGESGSHARPMSPDWARSLRDQCAAAGVHFLFKQWGEWLPMLGQVEGVPVGRKTTTPDGWVMGWAGKKAAGRLLDGVQHDAFPEVSHG